MDNGTKTLGAIVALILIVVGGAFAYRQYQNKNAVQSAPTTTSDNGFSNVDISGIPKGATVEITDRLNADLYNKTAKPSTSRAFPQGAFTKDQYAILLKNRQTLLSAIKANPAAMANWLNLGILYKQVGDYEGARMYWKYVVTVNPTNLSAHWNLGTLYQMYLKDSAKAEAEFNSVISLDTTYISAYIELANTYAYAGDKTKAIESLTRGIISNKNAIDLLIARAKLYAQIGDKAKAAADYQAAIALAKSNKNDSLVATLTGEMNAIQ